MKRTMADLRREVANRLRSTLHGKEIDTMEKGMPKLPHMLGIVTIGAISTDKAISGSLLDPEHEFWDEYYKDVATRASAESEIESAVRSLRDDEIFTISTPYGEEAGIWYCEVEEMNDHPNLITSCTECGAPLSTTPEIKRSRGIYKLRFSLDCPECDFEKVVGRDLLRL